MEFFNKYFNLVDSEKSAMGEYSVCCPFPHTDDRGVAYKETNPSAHINAERSVFHCKVCRVGMSEAAFFARMEGVSYKEALSLINRMKDSDKSDWNVKQDNLRNSAPTMQILRDLQIDRVAETLRLGFSGEGIDFPVFMYGELLDVRNYKPSRQPKVLGRKGSSNLIIPFDLWRVDDRPTLLCAGEKDMAIARAHGFNAISFTGGEGSVPKLFKASFKDKNVYICYDNDSAGHNGARTVALFIKEAGGTPYIVKSMWETCSGKGEDLHDYFVKYGKNENDLQKLLDECPVADDLEFEAVREEMYPMVQIAQAAKGGYANARYVRSRVNVQSIYDDMFNIPEYVRFTKMVTDEVGIMRKGDYIEWMLDENSIQEILYLFDSGITEQKRNAFLRKIARVPDNERGLKMSILSTTDVYKAVVSDILETSDKSNGEEDSQTTSELTIYSIKNRFLAGKQYEIRYKPVSHPFNGQKVVGICTEVTETSTSIERFQITPAVVESLRPFQKNDTESVEDKMTELYERTKGFVGVEAAKYLAWATDMFYHTPLEFKMGRRIERAYMDVMIIGDSRTMKSQTAKRMREMYELGTVVSLKTTTEGALIGGSDKVQGGGYRTKLGAIPQSHKGAIIMEEFSGGGRKIISGLTEVRSSGRVRLGRVSGLVDIAAQVRMLSISNVATKSGISLGLNQYPSGVQVILDLVGASEDIARYDFFLLVEEAKKYTNPLDDFDLEPFEKESYMNRIRWVWSRSAEQVELSKDVAAYLVKCADKLNELYDCHIKFFGAEAWKKLARVAISVAAMLVSTDESFEKIVVTKEHINFAANFMRNLYDNSLFKLKNYVDNERAYRECREVDIHTLQKMYASYGATLNEMEVSTALTQKQLQLISGLDMSQFSDFVSRLGASKFIQWQGERIVPTGKFRQAMRSINKNIHVKSASERGNN